MKGVRRVCEVDAAGYLQAFLNNDEGSGKQMGDRW